MLRIPRRIASRTIASYPHLALHEHDVSNEAGSAFDRQGIADSARGPSRRAITISLDDWCVAAAVTDDRQWVLVEQHRHGVDALTWEPAGGIIDPNEKPDIAAERELLEETGYGGGRLSSLGWVHPNPALSSNKAHLFVMQGARRMQEPEQAFDEETRVILVSRDDAERTLEDGRITHALGVLAMMRALALVERG